MPLSKNIESTVQLRDGRALGILQSGKSNGPAVFHFHGHGSSRLEVQLLAEAAMQLGVHLIGLDRPGIGLSDPKPDFCILDWPDDVNDAADRLGIERFAVEGLSAGGIYVLACAYKIPHRLTACGLISSAVPDVVIGKFGPRWMRATWWAGKRFPWLFRPLINLVSRARGATQASVEAWLLRCSMLLGQRDQALAIREIRAIYAAALKEASSQGRKRNLQETLADFGPWGFTAKSVAFEKIFMWHGEQDRVVPAALARRFAQCLPQCAATFYTDEGHLSLLPNHARDILQAMSAA